MTAKREAMRAHRARPGGRTASSPRRRSSAPLIAGLGVLLATACGDHGADGARQSDAGPCAALLADAPVTIDVRWDGPWDEIAGPAFIERFAGRWPAITARVAALPYGETVPALAAEHPPTLVRVPVGTVGALAAAGRIRPLDGCLDDQIGATFAATQPLGMADGTRHGVAGNVEAVFLAYDATVFRAAGLDPDRPPGTWPELLDVARTIRDRVGIASPVAGLSPLMAVLESAPTEPLPPAARTWLQLADDGLLLDGAHVGPFPPLGDHRAALQAVAPADVWDYASSLAQGQSPTADLRIAPLPGATAPLIPIGGSVWVVSATATDAQAAAATALLSWLLEDPQQAMMHQLTDLYPTSPSAATDPLSTQYWAGLPLLADSWTQLTSRARPPQDWMLVPGAAVAAHHLLAEAPSAEAAARAWSDLGAALSRAHEQADAPALLACTFPSHHAPVPLTACTNS